MDELTNYELIEHFENAVRDNHYQPTSKKCNESDFSYDELKSEIEKRLRSSNYL